MKKIWIILILLLMSNTVNAFPKYTTRENALRLAKVIDKGVFNSHRIASAFVKNRTPNEFYLQVILDDGSSHEWLMDRIYQWALNDQLVLANNRVLVFPSDESTEFYVLDKNAFYRLALSSSAFVKTYKEHDLLAEKNLKFAMRRFRLIQPEDDDLFVTDNMGNRFRYVLEFKNGSREILTYLSAYQLMHNGAFIQKPGPTDIILNRAFQVQGMKATRKKVEDEIRNIWSFGVEVLLNQPMPLSPDLFPIQIVEETMRHPETGERQTRFYIHVLFPNTEQVQEIPEIRTLEYLQHVNIITDIAHQNRVFLRAQINPDVFELPPYIQVTNRQSVKVNFFIVTDQSMVKRPDFVEISQAKTMMHPALEPMPKDTEYDKYYLAAVEKIRSVQGHHSLHLKIETYLAAVELLKKAAMNTKTDQQVAQALQQRDVLFDVLPKMVVENTQQQLHRTDRQFDRSMLLRHIEHAEHITTNREFLKQLRILRSSLMN
ncbi:MAG: hypothetical protein HQM14_02555 [SAR324 cluster bacterium]|nr:hypothetical protein [SAR324 cluster bacterium]